MFSTFIALLNTLGLTAALVLPRELDPDPRGRDWQSAVQNINGMNSILTLLPVLTGKMQNVKLVASRIFPASFVMAGIGAGRVLSKLQLGILLWSFELYRSTVGELSYAHDEYINAFMPKLQHVPTGTPERHTTSLIVNHNMAETYMVEAWFQARGRPSTIRLKQNNYTRLCVGSIIYLALYSTETFLAVQNGAEGTRQLLIVVQAITVALWLVPVIMIQIARGQGKAEVDLNRIGSPEYRCLQMPNPGEHVISEVFSFHLNNLSGFQLYNAKYEQPMLRVAGGMILLSGFLDVVSTILIVGLTNWAYPWIGAELVIILAKVVFCLEPVREIEIASVVVDASEYQPESGPEMLPLKIQFGDGFVCKQVTTDYTIVHNVSHPSVEWRSTTAGLWVGQSYIAPDSKTSDGASTRYVAMNDQKKLTLATVEPEKQSNQALHREFLAALATVVEANVVPSEQFITAIEKTMDNIERTMTAEWYAFGSRMVFEKITKAKRGRKWRRFL
ncbi:uncharacterized protein A1O9_10080 [Exophiala aquamarina CBS 119918]|uniref:Uncharacterized protein n=1 Tax=Exophiala aquamarina CBS 119918 TaxID=1182545 RepID=A0A072PDN9_9EURO|nr:uncharacterized protein A1O9_10080 [Exophiala aquamarina CBS 119918]KEF53680.1 hypothetical protein A1O9_10080 [Exophiala aquamarina CBS 119918]